MRYVFLLIPLFVAACSSCASQRGLYSEPRGTCLTKTISQSGLMNESMMQNVTEAECAEELQIHCSNAAKNNPGVVCSLMFKRGGPGQPISHNAPAQKEQKDPGEYDDV